MRTLFLLLVFANVAFLAWARYLSPADAVADPAPLARQIEPDKLKIVGRGEPRALAPPAAAPSPVSAAAAPPPALACLE
ncbi:MAG TPA: hypothetical protein VEA99_12240, partial [Gemmatimonadaceae bacterium]|nr:hypothetical protein [Gemmatimonadaceae bacterium]